MSTPNLAVRLQSFWLPSSDIELLVSKKEVLPRTKYQSLIAQIEQLSGIPWNQFKNGDYWAKYDPISIFEIDKSNFPSLAIGNNSLLVKGIGSFLNEDARPYPYRFSSEKEKAAIAVAIKTSLSLRNHESKPIEKPIIHYKSLDWLKNLCSELNLERDLKILTTKTAQLTATLTYEHHIKPVEGNPRPIKHLPPTNPEANCYCPAIS